MNKLPQFYQIVDDVRWLERFLPLGLQLVQLRIKDKPIHVVREQIRHAKRLCDDSKCQLIINDYWQEAIDAGCDYIHLGQEDLETADIASIKRQEIKIGISTHDSAELNAALSIEPNYIALGPVYHTVLKAMKWSPQGIEKITRWKHRLGDIPLVAIGGLTIERAPNVYRAGADSICVVTDVLRNEMPEQRLQQWLRLATNNHEANRATLSYSTGSDPQ